MKKKLDELALTKKNKKKKNYLYYDKVEHMEIACWKETKDLEKKVNILEGDVVVVCSTNQPTKKLPFLLARPKHYMPKPHRVSESSILVVLITWLRMLLCSLP